MQHKFAATHGWTSLSQAHETFVYTSVHLVKFSQAFAFCLYLANSPKRWIHFAWVIAVVAIGVWYCYVAVAALQLLLAMALLFVVAFDVYWSFALHRIAFQLTAFDIHFKRSALKHYASRTPALASMPRCPSASAHSLIYIILDMYICMYVWLCCFCLALGVTFTTA